MFLCEFNASSPLVYFWWFCPRVSFLIYPTTLNIVFNIPNYIPNWKKSSFWSNTKTLQLQDMTIYAYTATFLRMSLWHIQKHTIFKVMFCQKFLPWRHVGKRLQSVEPVKTKPGGFFHCVHVKREIIFDMHKIASVSSPIDHNFRP